MNNNYGYIDRRVIKNIILVITTFIVFVSSNITSLAEDRVSGCQLKLDSNVSPRIEYKKPLHFNISAEGVNHLSFRPSIITTIWGDNEEYSAILSDNGSELFVTSKLGIGKDIALAVELAGGKVIDLVLHVKDIPEPKIVKFNLQKVNTRKRALEAEVTKMLNAMRLGKKSKYYVREVEHKFTIKKKPGLLVQNKKLYQFGNLLGLSLIIKNNSKRAIAVDGEDIRKGFDNVIAVQSDNIVLVPRSTMTAFLIIDKQEV